MIRLRIPTTVWNSFYFVALKKNLKPYLLKMIGIALAAILSKTSLNKDFSPTA
jgi:hypothetical protein